jgi:protein-tyrosine phosphatase
MKIARALFSRHGTMPLTELPYGFKGRVFGSAMPFGTHDEDGKAYQAYIQQAVSVVVVLADDEECFRKTNRVLRTFYSEQGFKVIHLPIRDRGVPGKPELARAIAATVEAAQGGRHVGIHCLAGHGRTGTFAACMAKQALGLTGKQALRWVRKRLPAAVETSGQKQFVLDY